MDIRYEGLIAATFTPMDDNGSLNLDVVQSYVEHLIKNGIKGLYVCGSTGEGALLSTLERFATAQSFVKAANGRIPVIVQVGHNSLTEACRLAQHAQEINADAIAAVPPSYFKCKSSGILVDCMATIASSASDLPFFYYHVPDITGTFINVLDFLRLAQSRIANFAGIKYTSTKIHELQMCIDYFNNGRLTILYGIDEMLISGLVAGARGFIGSTFNFAAPLYHKIIEKFQEGDIAQARKLQSQAIRMIKICYDFRGHPAFKALMKITGIDCGVSRLPQESLNPNEIKALAVTMQEVAFFRDIIFKKDRHRKIASEVVQIIDSSRGKK